MPELRIRVMRPEDLPAIHALQCRAYPADYHEPVAALASRLAVGPEFCFVAERGCELAGYVFAHPWAGEPPALHAPLRPAGSADHVFLHDLAVCPACRGMAAGGLLQAAVVARAAQRGFAGMRLVAVGAARLFWQRMGFDDFAGDKLHATYGEAVVMEQRL